MMKVRVSNDLCIEILFAVNGSEKYDLCWMGKMFNDDADIFEYWFGLTQDGNNAFSYDNFESISNAKIFEGRYLMDV